jgi:7-carboxy-7-deazaguanine synthase
MQYPLYWKEETYDSEQINAWEIPMVEIFETVEGEGMKAGYPTVFVRVFHCNLRCTWCDTPYSYAPAKPEYTALIKNIIKKVRTFPSQHICLTGGEPLIHKEKSAGLIHQLSQIDYLDDIHIETNGAIDLQPFAKARQQHPTWTNKVRFIMDFKLPNSGEMDRMIVENFNELNHTDEIKFVIGSDEDFDVAVSVIQKHHKKGVILMSPVWETMPPRKLVEKVLEKKLSQVKVNMQLHKIIWDPSQRGV